MRIVLKFLGISVVTSSVLGLIASELGLHRDILVVIYSFGALFASLVLGYKFKKFKISFFAIIVGCLAPIFYLMLPMLLNGTEFGLQSISLTAAFATLLGSILEELGWREFLYNKFLKLGMLKMSVLVGVMWSMWHWPAILTGSYSFSGNLLFGVIFFTFNLILMSYVFACLRIISGTVTAPILAHFAHNIIFDLVVSDTNITEYGPTLSLSLIVLVFFFYFIGVYFVGKDKHGVDNHCT